MQEEKFAGQQPDLADEEAKAAAVMVLFEVLKYEKANYLFKQRHWAHYLNNFQKFHQDTIAKLRDRKQEIRLEAYTSRASIYLLDEMPPNSVAIAFLPTYAGGYERMFKRLEEIFAWDPAGIRHDRRQRKVAILEKMKARDYLFLYDKVWEDLPQVAVVCKARMKPVYIYSNMAALRLGVMKQQRHADFVPYARLSDADEITPASKRTVTPTSNRVVKVTTGDVICPRAWGFLQTARRRLWCRWTADTSVPRSTPECKGVGTCTFWPTLWSTPRAISEGLEAPAAGDSNPGSASAPGRKITVGDSQMQWTMVFTDKPVSMKYRGLTSLPGGTMASWWTRPTWAF